MLELIIIKNSWHFLNFEIWHFLHKRAYIWVTLSVLDEDLGFHRTQGNAQLRSSLVRYRSIFEGYMLILNGYLWVTLIFHMNEFNKNKIDKSNICCINKLVPYKRATLLANKGVILRVTWKQSHIWVLL